MKYLRKMILNATWKVYLRAADFSTTECGTEVFVFCFLLSTTFQEYSVIFLLSITEIQVEGTPASTDAENDNESKTSCSCNFSLVPNKCLSYP